MHILSAVAQRLAAYANNLGSIHVLVFATKHHALSRNQLDSHITLTPTQSRSRWWYVYDAYKLGKTLPKPDCITVQDPFECGLVGLLLARHFNVPLHVQVHTDFLTPSYLRLSPLNHMRVIIARIVLRYANRVRAVSDRIKTSILHNYLTKGVVTILPIFVDIEKFRAAPVDSMLAARFERFTKKVLVVSRLEPEKNSMLALASFAALDKKETCLVVVGDGSQRQSLENKVRELNLADNVFFEGEKAAIQYYPIADLVLVPSTYEGYGMVIIEALARGVPVLSGDVGIAREAGAIITDTVHFAEALKKWFVQGPFTATLKNYPYKNFDEYVQKYCDDIKRCIEAKKTLQ
jgi:glycosyltransferase involved in cell wall biosynthesis